MNNNNKEFKINNYITLKLEDKKTFIYVNNKKFRQCNYLLLNIPINQVVDFDKIQSIDEAAEKLDNSLEPRHGRVDRIPPEIEFWGHCSNMQIWAEHDYDTNLLHRNLAFPLLKELSELRDDLARKVFKEEIAKRVKKGTLSVILYLAEEGYLDYLNKDEIETIYEDIESMFMNQPKSVKKEDFHIITTLAPYISKERLLEIYNGKKKQE